MRYFILLFFITSFAYSQNDTIQLLEEVKLYGAFSKNINAGYQIQIIKDSVINNNSQTLGNILQSKANLYFKQNGNGMVSSISLRGSGASHTGVYWNGIAINSSLNGQTDFNTLSANGFNQIEIRKGAGSVLFGSGAIGGAINLRDKIYYISKKRFSIGAGIASYNTQNISLKSVFSNTKFYTKITAEGNQSDNNYPYLNTNLTNENAAYKNYHIKGVFAYKLNFNNQIQLFSTFSNNNRELSRTLTAPSNSKYKNTDQRVLLKWKNFGDKYNSSLKLAYLNEKYEYFPNKNSTDFSFGKSNNLLLKYDFNYNLSKKWSFLSGIENKFTKGSGTNILKKEKNVFEVYLLAHQKPTKKLSYNLSFRKGFSKTYKIPFIYAFDLKYKLLPTLNIKTNYTTNYKLPTFNDLYWNFSGNENLLPENSKSAELGLDFHMKQININITSFISKSDNLIQWRPISSNFWRPINIQSVTSSGIEFEFHTQKKINKHRLYFQMQYAYTKSEDNVLNKQLIYIPYHKANTEITYKYKEWSALLNLQYNGSVYTTTSNTETVSQFWLSNIHLNKTFLKNKLNIGFGIHNLFNIAYQTVAYRPMPNRNFNLNLNIKL